jgi:hypothetical protein
LGTMCRVRVGNITNAAELDNGLELMGLHGLTKEFQEQIRNLVIRTAEASEVYLMRRPWRELTWV